MMKHLYFLAALSLLWAGSGCSDDSSDSGSGRYVFNPDARLYVEGRMIDIRPVTEGGAVYPQCDGCTFSGPIVALMEDGAYSCATSLRESRGVEYVWADYATLLRIGVATGIDPGPEWAPGKTRFQVGSTMFSIYTRPYETTGEKVAVPSGEGVSATLVFARSIVVEGVPAPPGTVIARSPAAHGRKISNPSIAIRDDGSYFVGCAGPHATGNSYYRSTDRGRKWELLSNPEYMNYCMTFIRPADPHTIYEMGVTAAKRGDIVIRKSEDGGRTWSSMTTLFEGDYHGAPSSYVVHEGRIWRAMGISPEDESRMSIIVVSIAEDADPMEPSNWTMTNALQGGPQNWIEGSGISYDNQRNFNQWQEGWLLLDPDGRLTVVTRVDESNRGDVAALIRVVDPNTITFDPVHDFIDMPGGGKRFTIRYDERTHKYWTLANPCYDEDRWRTHSGWYANRINPLYLRSRLVLCSSPDLRHWTMEKEVISSNNVFFHGFQYTDWVFDGEDMIAVIRTAFPESRGLPDRQHDANMLLFRRIENFRTGGFETAKIEYDQLGEGNGI